MRALVVVMLLSGVATAFPPFARKYGQSCSTCHVGGPSKLTAFGEAFRDNGYHMPGGDEPYLREQQMSLGSAARAALWPKAVWPGELPGATPVGVAGIVGVSASLAPPGQTSTLTFPASALLLAGGTLGAHVALIGEIEAGTGGVAVPSLFGVVRSVFQRWFGENTLNLKIGRMQFDLFSVQPRLQRSITPMLPMSLVVGRDGFTLAAPDEAIELYGLIKGRVKWVVGIANGVKPVDDLSTRRDFFARISAKLGGPRLDYKNAVATDDERATATIGVAGYYGVGVVAPAPPETRFRNEIARVIGDVRLRVKGLDILGQVVLGRDSNPDNTNTAVLHVAWSAEADYSIFPWLQPYVRYEEARFDTATHTDRRRLDIGFAIFARANIRIRAEGAVGLAPNEPHLIMTDIFFGM